MISHRKKIFLFELLSLFLILLALYPLVGKSISKVTVHTYEKKAKEIVKKIKKSSSVQEVKEKIKEQSPFEHINIYPIKITHPIRSAIEYDPLLQKELFIYEEPLVFGKESYIFHAAYSIEEMRQLQKIFEWGYIIVSFVIFLLYSFLTGLLLHRLSSPITHIINSIKYYQQGEEEFLPQIELQGSLGRYDEFGKLVNTLNSLSAKIQHQIESLTYQKNEHQSILNSLVEGVLAINSQNSVTYANSRACDMFALSNEELIGGSLLSHMASGAGPLLKKCNDLAASCQKRGKIVTEPLYTEEKKNLYLDILAIPRAFKSGAVLVLQDKTSDYKMLQMGKDFIANASHELKTPLTIIRGFAETLCERKKLTVVQQKEVTQKILSTCERLNTLVQNLLTLADIENLPSTPSSVCNLLPIVENCRHMILELHKEATVIIEHKEEEYLIYGDLSLLEHAIVNVMDNAIKYSKPSGKIYLSLNKKNEKISLQIRDEGIGIPNDDIPHIFGRFYTVDKARSRKFGGAGLGLSIVKTILDKHNAKIEVESKIKKGTTFTFSFAEAKINEAISSKR